MQQKPTKQSGFAHLGIVIILLLTLAVIGFGGWYVWQNNKNEDRSGDIDQIDQNKNRKQDNSSLDATTKWESVTTEDGAFSMKVPDGWMLIRYPGNYIGATSATYTPGTKATIESSTEEYVGHSISFRASITPLDDAGLGPQWASPQPGLQESVENFSINGLEGKRYKGVFTQDLDQTIYEYVFAVGDDKKLDIVYTVDHSKNDEDQVAIVEKAIKTIQLK